ncbi:hypothetical protein TI39_contig315g00021 [Zymoseptoria brevis]|uniref:Uncharacterized protein n=1 Tax=Zymoseptoria brevis TaxID=1047168 RepID=A0A0F4GTK1_9PEZI|nr:hypothetical protein TI39_contig315g00021 [Zymoseptoria brevis]
MVAIGQTITIVNKSGKVVGTSKHIVNVFKEAKSAYAEKKAEIKANRKAKQDLEEDELRAQKALRAMTIEDDTSDTSSKHGSRRGSDSGRSTRRKPVPSRGRERPPVERGVSDSFYANDGLVRHDSLRPSPLRQGSTVSLGEDDPRMHELTRRHTDGMQLHHKRVKGSARSASADDIDMDLAYGELPPPLPARKGDEEVELRTKMSALQRLLDEANCVQHSATATIENLQKNPEALAAVALTLAEISNLVAKMSPGAIMAMKSAFPAILALLASPQFAIAAGVGVGVTIIAFGGYKIIKKIKARDEKNLLEDGVVVPDSPTEEMDELRELDRIEMWRRGIADEQAASSVGTSVEGNFVTPGATRTLIEEGKITEADLKPKEKKHRKKKSRSEASGSTSKTSKTKKTKASKEPSMFRSLFKGNA